MSRASFDIVLCRVLTVFTVFFRLRSSSLGCTRGIVAKSAVRARRVLGESAKGPRWVLGSNFYCIYIAFSSPLKFARVQLECARTVFGWCLERPRGVLWGSSG